MIVHLIKEVGAESGKREVGPLAKVTLFTSLSNLAKLMNIIMELMMMMKMVMMMVDIMFANDVPSPYWVGDFCADGDILYTSYGIMMIYHGIHIIS